MTERAGLPGAYGGWADSVEAVNSLVDDLVRPTTEVGRVIAAVAQGDLSQKMALTIEGQPVKGEFSPHRPDRERDGRPARLLRRRGHARRARGRHGRQARRPGRGQGRLRHVARPDRLRERDGREPHRAGAPDRAGDDRGRQRRPHPAGDGRRARRGARAQAHDQRDGRAAVVLRRRGHARRARGGHRRRAGRPGAGRGRLRHVARPHRVGERDGLQPDRPGAPDRAGHDRGRQRRPDAEGHGRGQGRGRARWPRRSTT